MNKGGLKNNIDVLAGMIVLAIFAAGIISSLLAGAGAYRRLTERDEEEYEARVCTQYIFTKVSGANTVEDISIEQPDGMNTPVLRIREEIDGEEYSSYIYSYNGWICELFTAERPDFTAGSKLVQAKKLDFFLDGNLFTSTVTTNAGELRSVCVCVGEGSGEEASA